MGRPTGPREGGSRYLYEPFDSAHARIETLEQVLDVRLGALELSLKRIDQAVDRLEKRLWVAVFGVATALVGQFVAVLMQGVVHP